MAMARLIVRVRSRLVLFGGLLLTLMGIGFFGSASPAGAEPALATVKFDFRDTSGEVRDQTAEHEARLDLFDAALRAGLSEGRKVRPVAMACGSAECSLRKFGIEALSKEARTAGARYLLVGEVHKMSTLVGWVKFAVLDLDDNKATCDRYLTYRGDTDEAWRRAARFAAKDIAKSCLP